VQERLKGKKCEIEFHPISGNERQFSSASDKWELQREKNFKRISTISILISRRLFNPEKSDIFFSLTLTSFHSFDLATISH
jgi:hypothetical protein